ncbi:MAG: DUF2442 domain-containing protein [Oscillospiraceae bacterium]|jgi:hypothetical protein|nr:DUF2442 domain-containing protein [Oscillospiraceae bacterium]
MFYKVKDVQALPNYLLYVKFENGEDKHYNVARLFDKWNAFASLLNDELLFRQVKIDLGGYGVSWNDDIDLSCDELYHNGV